MLSIGIICCALVVTANAGYASSSSGGAGLYNTNAYSDQSYGPKYPYSTQYSGYTNAGGSAFPYYQPFAPLPQFATPYDVQNAYQQYFNQLSSFNANLFNQQLAYQNQLYNNIRNQALGGGGYGGGAYGGAGGFAGGSTGSYGGVGPSGGSYGGTYGGYAPNYASAGGAVGNGYQQQHASIYPVNAGRPNLDSRFGGDSSPVGVSHSQGPPGFVGVSSFSSSSDVNGVKHRESGTSVNNDGKVTTYHVRN